MAQRPPQADATPRNTLREQLAQKPYWVLGALTLLALLPFLGKPFNIDDPLFVWVAQHIRAHPLDPYGFNVNWYGYDWPLWDITKNPPLAGYYLAAFGSVFGWSEAALHGAMLLPAVAVILGTYRLARHFCERPGLAALLALFTPVFLVSATTVMCDILMLAFWVWALVFWIEGAQKQRAGLLAAASVCLALAALSKYFGACAIPVVAAWSLFRKQPAGQWLGWLAIPVGALIAYQLATRALYGHGLLADAGQYATAVHQTSILLNLRSLLTALSFTGGCMAVVTFLAPWLWPARSLLIGGAIALALGGVFYAAVAGTFPDKLNLAQVAQLFFWSAGGIHVLALAIADFKKRRDADALLLLCWLLGTFIFTAFFNWIVNGRSILPLAVPTAILVARRFAQRPGLGALVPRGVGVSIGLGAVLAWWVAFADYSLATKSAAVAEVIHTNYGGDSQRVWFEGHWGFQYYMMQQGATALDLQHLNLAKGDRIALPSDNSNVYDLKEPMAAGSDVLVMNGGDWLTTMNKNVGAGFYASIWGPLPFAFGSVPPQTVTIYTYDPAGAIPPPSSAMSQ